MRDLLEAGDVEGLRAAWAAQSPHLPQMDRAGAEIAMHRARTEAESVSLKARAYSHRWLTDRGLPSGIPDRLKPSAERLYPTVASGVGISVSFRAGGMEAEAAVIRSAMSDAVEEAYADGRTDPAFVRARMSQAKTRTMKLIGVQEREPLRPIA